MSRRKSRWKYNIPEHKALGTAMNWHRESGLAVVERLEHIAATLDRVEVLLSGSPLAQQPPTGTVNDAD